MATSTDVIRVTNDEMARDLENLGKRLILTPETDD